MTRRSPARLLAPLALVAVAIALLAVLSNASSGGEKEAQPTAAPAGSTKSGTTPKSSSKRRASGRRTYTVKPGDTPSGIAEKTGVPVQKLLDLNPDVDPQALAPGTRLKLR